MSRILYQSGDWLECYFLKLSEDGLEVEFGQNVILADDEGMTNIGWRIRVTTCREMLRRYDAGESPVTEAGVTFTRTAEGKLRIDWTERYSVDQRAFPPGRPASVVLDRSQLSAIA